MSDVDNPSRPHLSTLFFAFVKVSLLAVGGGYVILPLLMRDVVKVKGWITEEELADFYALGQTVPGIIAINTATLIGWRSRGLRGAVVAAVGMATPAIIIILLIAHLLINHFDSVLLHKALAGVRPAVVALVVLAVWQTGRKAVDSYGTILLFATTFFASVLWGFSPILLIVTGAGAGLYLLKRSQEVE